MQLILYKLSHFLKISFSKIVFGPYSSNMVYQMHIHVYTLQPKFQYCVLSVTLLHIVSNTQVP